MAATTASALAKHLRDLCARPGEFSVADVKQKLSTWQQEHGLGPSVFVNIGNSNGKTPLHFAAQLRNDGLATHLVDMQADVNVRTIRGHTPLIYACGRAHDHVIRMLLERGAICKVRTANGESALDMAQTRLPPPIIEELTAKLDAEPGHWIDMSTDADAIEAQADHVQSKPHCAQWESDMSPAVREALEKRRAEKGADVVDATAQGLATEVLGCLQDGVALSTALVQRTSGLTRKQAHAAIRTALLKAAAVARECKEEDGTAFLLAVLRTQRDSLHGLSQQLQVLGYTMRKSKEVKLLLTSAVLAAAREILQSMDSVPLTDLVSAAPMWMVPELLNSSMLGAVNIEQDVECLEEVLQTLCHPHAWGSDFGSALRWLQAMQKAQPERSEEAHFQRLVQVYIGCLQAACDTGHAFKRTMRDPGTLLSEVQTLLGPSAELPIDLQLRLRGQSEGSDDEEAEGVNLADFPCVVWPASASCTWIDGVETWQLALQKLADVKVVAVDTEWWGSGKGPALVQLAVGHGLEGAECYLVDTLNASPVLAAGLLSWLGNPALQIIGWSFQEDNKRLSELDTWQKEQCHLDNLQGEGHGGGNIRLSVTDLQPVCRKMMRLSMPPSLASAAAHLIGQRVDKSEQCSDWRRRPLTDSQRVYAALDACVLLELHQALQRHALV